MVEQQRGSITRQAYDRLLQICIEAMPIEACGILVSSNLPAEDFSSTGKASDDAVIDTIIPITNTHINPTYSFSFSPSEWASAYYDMQKNRQTLVGLFHSHPRTDAVPSSSDIEGFLPASELSYWIVSLKNIGAPHVQPYRRMQGVFIPLQLMLT